MIVYIVDYCRFRLVDLIGYSFSRTSKGNQVDAGRGCGNRFPRTHWEDGGIFFVIEFVWYSVWNPPWARDDGMNPSSDVVGETFTELLLWKLLRHRPSKGPFSALDRGTFAQRSN